MPLGLPFLGAGGQGRGAAQLPQAGDRSQASQTFTDCIKMAHESLF